MFTNKVIKDRAIMVISSMLLSTSLLITACSSTDTTGNKVNQRSYPAQTSAENARRLPFYQPMNSPAYFTDETEQYIPTNQQWLTLHNSVRQQHQVGNLVWSDTLAKSAQAFIRRCPSGHSGSRYGENIFFATAKFPLKDVFRHWYKEEAIYDYQHPKLSKKTGHFTQIVWKETTQVGCAYKNDCSGKWKHIWACHYSPKGNIRLRFAKNVFPKR